MIKSAPKIYSSKIYKSIAKPKKYKSSASPPSPSSSTLMMSIANIISNSSSTSSKKTIQEKIVKNNGLTVLSAKCRTIWPTKTQISKKRLMSSVNPSIATLIIQKIAIFGFLNLLDSIEEEESNFLTLLKNYKDSFSSFLA